MTHWWDNLEKPETIEAKVVGKTIRSSEYDGDRLKLEFDDGTVLMALASWCNDSTADLDLWFPPDPSNPWLESQA